jgi:hypothetical protein
MVYCVRVALHAHHRLHGPSTPESCRVRPDIKFDGDYVAGSKLPASPKSPGKNLAKALVIDLHKATTPLPSLRRNEASLPTKHGRCLRNEPGVLKLKDENTAKKRKRSYVTVRIPPEIAQRVKRRLS